jgi:hypothetical protein
MSTLYPGTGELVWGKHLAPVRTHQPSGFGNISKIPIRFKEVSLNETLKIVVEHRIYAMNVYTYTEARQNLASLLDQAVRDGEVRIKRKDGQIFVQKLLQK